MPELQVQPLAVLARRMLRELDRDRAIFSLPEKKFFLGDAARDLSVRFHGERAATPLGPAAGPHTQMAQNIVLSWLAGGRIMELKTVQIMDELQIPRPCIDMQTIGYNVEWSQELKLEQSLEEYVKASMLIRILCESGRLQMPPGAGDIIWDMSVGYDLAGIRSERVRAFMEGMKDASAVVERLRAQIPPDLAEFRDLDFTTRLSHTLTLSTFHGCPPGEIESIIDFLLTEVGLDCVVKLNPMLLGPVELRRLLHDQMGYADVAVPDTAFERDMSWDQMRGIVTRLAAKARSLGRTLGVKFTNTLIVLNNRDFFPATEKEMYLSGPPLHVLAMSLVRAFRREFGDALPISFSAGIDQKNFADAVAIGLVPVTVCSDLLKPGGYGRAQSYFKELARRMDAVGARDIDGFILRAHGLAEQALGEAGASAEEAARCLAALETGDERAVAGELYGRWLSASRVLNTEAYVARVVEDPRYGFEANRKPPRRLDSHLVLFDCVTCDKCIPVCPNDANFAYTLPEGEIPVAKAWRDGSGWRVERGESLRVTQKHQIGNFADFCNDCGNCDIFCPELGGPYKVKPRFFGSRASWAQYDGPDGLLVERHDGATHIEGRFSGAAFTAAIDGGRASYAGAGFSVQFDVRDPEGTLVGEATGEVDLTWFRIMDALARAVMDPSAVTYLSFAGATA